MIYLKLNYLMGDRGGFYPVKIGDNFGSEQKQNKNNKTRPVFFER